MANISDIVTKLLERTNQNRIGWQTTADDKIFLSVLGNNSVSISEKSELDFFAPAYVLRILNHEGREIERITSDSIIGSSERGRLQQLHEKARRIALGVDGQLDELLQVLETDT